MLEFILVVIFETHSTTYDNEMHLASGHYDVELSPLGILQAQEMGKRYESEHFDAIFCSDLQRSYKTAEVAFGNKFSIIKDARLRECNYGDLTRHSTAEIESEKVKRIKEPFPNGESYKQASARVKDFLIDLIKNYNGKKVMIIGHRATQYGLEHYIKNLTLEQIVTVSWQWQAGWLYELGDIRHNSKPKINELDKND